ncbi:MAG: vitamin K epoxide reductase family protein [bacterium]|nr:vitamin K epoxide reductase family protein [bacterium]
MNYVQLFIALCAICGFSISLYILKTKHRPVGKMLCPFHLQCDVVVNSKYGKTFGIHNEYGGMLYYGFTAIVYVLAFFSPALLPAEVYSLAYLASAGAFVFTLYLVFIMWRVLKAWCSWCITSATMSTLILLCSYWLYSF